MWKVVILNVLRQVSMLCHFCLFFNVFSNPVATPAHGLLGLSPSLRLRSLSENSSLLALYICATTHGPTSLSWELGLFSLDLVTVRCSYIFVPCLAFGDLNKTISFPVSVLSTSFTRTLLGLIHQNPSCPMQLSIFLNIFIWDWMFFEAMDLHRTLDLKSNPMDSSHFVNNFKRTINCSTTRANMNEPTKQRTDWRYHCSVMYVSQQWRSYHENFSYYYVTNVTEQQ